MIRVVGNLNKRLQIHSYQYDYRGLWKLRWTIVLSNIWASERERSLCETWYWNKRRSFNSFHSNLIYRAAFAGFGLCGRIILCCVILATKFPFRSHKCASPNVLPSAPLMVFISFKCHSFKFTLCKCSWTTLSWNKRKFQRENN